MHSLSSAGRDPPGRAQAGATPRVLQVYVVGPSLLPVLMVLHLALSRFILTSVHFITLQSRRHSYLVKETMTLLIFLNVYWVSGINLAGTDCPESHRSSLLLGHTADLPRLYFPI